MPNYAYLLGLSQYRCQHCCKGCCVCQLSLLCQSCLSIYVNIVTKPAAILQSPLLCQGCFTMAVNIVTKDALSANIHFFVRAVSIPQSTLLQRLLCHSNTVNIVVKAAVSANRHSLSGHSQYHCQHRYKGCCLPIVFTVNIVAKAAVRQLFSLSILLQRLLSANCYHCKNCCKDCGRQLVSLSILWQRLLSAFHHFFVYVCFHIEGGWTGSQGLVYIHT